MKQSFLNLYRQNRSIYYAVHICSTVFLVPLGFNFLMPTYDKKCYNPFLTVVVLLYWVVFLELTLEGYYKARDALLVLFLIYYVLNFVYMFCFIDESFDAEAKRCKDPVKRKIKEVIEKRKQERSPLVFRV